MHSQAAGARAEHLALAHLRQAGLRLITRNFRCNMGEIDLIMRDRSKLHANILVFVEVRYRRRSSHGGAAASVNTVKRQRLQRTAQRFIQLHRKYADWPSRFDVVAIEGDPEKPATRWITSAFDAQSTHHR